MGGRAQILGSQLLGAAARYPSCLLNSDLEKAAVVVRRLSGASTAKFRRTPSTRPQATATAVQWRRCPVARARCTFLRAPRSDVAAAKNSVIAMAVFIRPSRRG